MTMTEEAPASAGSTGPHPGASGEAPDAAKGKKGKGKGKKEKAAKGRSNLLPALVLAGGLAAGGYFMGGGADASATAASTVPQVVELEPGEMVRLDPITVNLEGGRYLRVGVAFRMSTQFESVEDAEGLHRFSADDEGRLRDQLIAMFAGRDGTKLFGVDQLDDTKAELLERAGALFEGHAIEVYLTDFVMQ